MAFKGYRRSIILDFNYDNVKKGVTDVNKQMALLNSEFHKASASATATGTSLDKLRINNQKLGSQVQLQKDKVAKLKSELDKLTASEDKNSKAVINKKIRLNEAQAQLTKLEESYRRSSAELEKANTLTGKFSLLLQDLSTGAERAGINLKESLGSMAAVITTVGTGAVSSAKSFMTFEGAMIKSRTIMDETSVSYEDMQKNVLDMAKEYGVSANIMAEANYQILSSGVETANANKVLEQSAILAKAGFTDVATAADILTSIMNGYGKSAEEASQIADTLIRTQKLGKLTVGELSASMGDLIPVAAAAGVPLEEVEAAIATMTLSGTKADTAITNMRQILSALISPTAQASKAAEELGIKFNGAAIESQGFAKWMDTVIKRTGGNTEAFGELFGNIRSFTGIISLANSNGEEFNSILSDIKNSSGAANDALGLIGETTTSKFNKAMNELSITLIEVGETLAPLISMATTIIKVIAAIPSKVIVLVGVVMTICAAAKTLGVVITALGAAGYISSGGILSVGAALTTLTPIIMGVAAAIAVIIGLIALLTKKTDEATESVNNTTEKASEITGNLNNSIRNNGGRRAYAIGTQYHRGGVAYVGEYGPEEVWLPEGSRVVTARDTKKNLHRQENDTGNLEMLLKEVINKMDKIEANIKEQPRKQQQLLRMGTV